MKLIALVPVSAGHEEKKVQSIRIYLRLNSPEKPSLWDDTLAALWGIGGSLLVGGDGRLFYGVRLVDRFRMSACTYVHILNSKFRGHPLL
jgi:hypothetical protein